MRMYDIIEKKRDKKQLSKEEIDFFIKGYTQGNIPDYQASALLMAIYLNGMTSEETTILTKAMAYSGEVIDLTKIDGIKVDKHSTGGVGDKTTLIVAPIVASLGIPFAKMSGRGLGHTGGTIDKLESIPGFHTALSPDEFMNNVKRSNIAITSQSGDLTPADSKLYSLRDSTATVSCIPLIASSIISKKIAGGADKILLDVKTGSGSFMKTFDQSLELAKEMVVLGSSLGKETIALISDMDQPLGNSIGNSIEVKEAIDSLRGKGPIDLMNLCINICINMVCMAKGCNDLESKDIVLKSIADRSAMNKFIELIKLQGGDVNIADDYSLFIDPSHKLDFKASFSGYIQSMHAGKIGAASMILGAGREKKEDQIDPGAGIYLHKKSGDHVEKDDVIASFYTNKKESLVDAANLFETSISYSSSKPHIRKILLAKVTENETTIFEKQKN